MITFILFGIIGVILTVIVAVKPKLFWPLLIISAIATAGIMVMNNTYLDEYLSGCLLFGTFMAISVGNILLKRSWTDNLTRLHKLIFIIMIAYMIIQSCRGLLILGGLQKIRWVVFYVLLGILSFFLSVKNFSMPSGRKLSFLIASTTLGYLIVGVFGHIFQIMPFQAAYGFARS